MNIMRAEKKLVNKLVAECTENTEEVKIAKITSAELRSMELHSKELHTDGHENVCVCSYATCVILAVIALSISFGIGAYFAYSCWYLKEYITRVKFDTRAQTTI